MTKTKKDNEIVVATEEENAIVAFDFGDDAGAGVDDLDSSDITIPFIKLLQAISPEVKRGDAQLEGAEEGMFMNGVTKEFIDGEKGFLFLPGVLIKSFIEYKPNRGGFVGQHAFESAIVLEAKARAKDEGAKFGKYTTQEDNTLEETWSYYGATLDANMVPNGIAIISFTSSKIKKIKAHNYRLKAIKKVNGQTPPLFSLPIRVTSVTDKSPDGAFMNIALTFAVNNSVKDSMIGSDTEAYQAAKAVRDGLAAGTTKADFNSEAGEDNTDADGPAF